MGAMSRRLVVATTLTVAAGITAIPAFAATKNVTVGDNWFVKKSGVPTVTVKRGDTVRWRFKGSKPHDVVVTKGPVKFRSPVKTKGTYRKKMTRRGTYTIICDIHGAKDQSMKLRVR